VRPYENRAGRAGFSLVFNGLKPGFAWFQTLTNPAKSRFSLFAVWFTLSAIVWRRKFLESYFLS
jgi:hypothetical protein